MVAQQLQREVSQLELEIEQRMDVVMCQALGALGLLSILKMKRGGRYKRIQRIQRRKKERKLIKLKKQSLHLHLSWN